MAAASRARRAAIVASTIAVVAPTFGCGNGRVDPRRFAPPSATASASRPPPPPSRVLLSFLGQLPSCDVDHRGLVVDAGTPAMATRYGWSGTVPQGVTDVEHDGSTWARVADRSFDLTFALGDKTPLFVSARAQGRGAKSAQVLLDDQPLGTLTFGRDQIKTATTGTTAMSVDAGLHTITMRFFGRSKDEGAFADIDWIRIGVPDDAPPETYGAPTLKDIVAPAASIAGVPHKAIAMRAPGSVRCPLRIAKSSMLRAFIGLQGDGAGDAEVRVVVDGKPTQVAETVHVESGPAAKWVPIERPLAEYGGGVVTLELIATHTSKGSRILFGDPEVVLPTPAPPPVPPARAVVVVILDGVERQELPPWSAGPSPLLPNLQELATSATTFDHHRAPSSVVSSVVASLLTGAPPRSHGVVDAGARLPAAQTTMAVIARDASVRTAMFTGVPTTFRPFGFGAGWEKFAEFAPSSGDPASALDAAAAWIADVARSPGDPRALVVVHARGGHPPWDVRDLANVPPKDYAGLIEPRRAAQIFAKLRKRKAREALSDGDRTRVRALEQLALGGEDRALGGLVAAMKTANLWEQSLFIVTGDVASGVSDAFLYGDGLDLKEAILTLPLYVHFPAGLYAGRRVTDATEIYDVTRTALGALGLSFGRGARGRDLASVASELEAGAGEPQVATLGDKYSVRWGDLVLSGRFPRAPDLCDLSLDAACAFNRRDVMPLATLALFRRLVLGDAAGRGPVEKREPATLDGDIIAQLSVWGQD